MLICPVTGQRMFHHVQILMQFGHFGDIIIPRGIGKTARGGFGQLFTRPASWSSPAGSGGGDATGGMGGMGGIAVLFFVVRHGFPKS